VSSVSHENWPEPVRRVADFLREAGAEARLEEFEAGTSTARDAALVVGCELAQIVKSLVFDCDGRPVVALVPGDRRADAEKIAAAANGRFARIAGEEEVREATGFEPGAVAPFPLPKVARAFIDGSLLVHPVVWVGAGSPRHLAALSPLELARLARAEQGDLTESDRLGH
jgi:prolyl-tRNA editing enzyme YbaK/EbsC (Cys-tRNA(Pro) deacylase)